MWLLKPLYLDSTNVLMAVLLTINTRSPFRVYMPTGTEVGLPREDINCQFLPHSHRILRRTLEQLTEAFGVLKHATWNATMNAKHKFGQKRLSLFLNSISCPYLPPFVVLQCSVSFHPPCFTQ